MPACVISFSGRRDGNCSAVAQSVRDALSGRDSVQYFDCSALALTPCGGCGGECFQARERCPYFDDPVFGMYDAVTRSSMSYFVVPNYCDYPCANFFLFNERSQCYFQGRPELLEQYERAPKKFIVVSNTGRDNFITAFQYHTGDAPPDVLFLSARRFGKVSIRGDLMGSPDARAEVLRFINP